MHNLSIGEWHQNVFNAQQICKANDFNMAWCTSATSRDTTNLNNHPNMLDFDIRLDRMPHNIDKKSSFSCITQNLVLKTQIFQISLRRMYAFYWGNTKDCCKLYG